MVMQYIIEVRFVYRHDDIIYILAVRPYCNNVNISGQIRRDR